MRALRERIAKELGWTIEQTEALSLVSLRELVRPVNPKLAHVITGYVAGGEHLTEKGR